MKLYVLALHNPQSGHPLHALYPHDAKSAGHQLWSLLNETMPLTLTAWLDGTDRANILSDTTLSVDYRSAAARRGVLIRPWIEGRWTVLIGSSVAKAVGHDAPPLQMGGPTGRWVSIPSLTRNAYYNDPINRAAAGRTLAMLWALRERN